MPRGQRAGFGREKNGVSKNWPDSFNHHPEDPSWWSRSGFSRAKTGRKIRCFVIRSKLTCPTRRAERALTMVRPYGGIENNHSWMPFHFHRDLYVARGGGLAELWRLVNLRGRWRFARNECGTKQGIWGARKKHNCGDDFCCGGG